jgi:hypothetical protein
VREVVQRSPRLLGRPYSRWTLAALGQVVPWLQGKRPGTIQRVLRRLGVRYKRGRTYLHSPDPAYDRKLAAITAAQLLARANPGAVVLLYEDELTYYRKPTVSRDWAPVGADAPRAVLGLRRNTRRRIAACLDAIGGQLVAWQRDRFDRSTLARFYAAVAATYPDAEVIFLAQDNWPVHTHPDLLHALPPHLVLLPLPTYAPWTNPVEDLWRGLYAEVLHLHPFGDDWPGLQAAVTAWLEARAADPATLLHFVGLPP